MMKTADDLLGTMPDTALAQRLGLGRDAVRRLRVRLGIPAHRPPGRRWTRAEERLLGRAADRVIAERIGRSVKAVWLRRRQLGIAPAVPHQRRWSRAEAGYWDYLAAGVEQPPCRCGEIECRHGAAHYWGEWPSTAEQMAAAYAAMDRRAGGGQ